MTPDWSATAAPVPYAKLDNPQSLNLYADVLNNPVTGVDADGHVVNETRTVRHYQITAEKVAQAVDLAKAHIKGVFSGDTQFALSVPTFKWRGNARAARGPGGEVAVTGKIISDVVALNQTVNIPVWKGYSKASAADRKTWDTLVAALSAHEAQHEAIDRRVADGLDKSLPGLTAAGIGKGLSVAEAMVTSELDTLTTSKKSAAVSLAMQQNLALDNCTGHGTHPCK